MYTYIYIYTCIHIYIYVYTYIYIYIYDHFGDLYVKRFLVNFGYVLGPLGPQLHYHSNRHVEKPFGTYSQPLGSPWSLIYKQKTEIKKSWSPNCFFMIP